MSYRLHQLETALGVRLINRTSRSQSVTDAGALFYEHAVEMLERADFGSGAADPTKPHYQVHIRRGDVTVRASPDPARIPTTASQDSNDPAYNR